MIDKSILHQLSESGQQAPRVQLKGSEAAEASSDRYQIVGELARGGVGVVYKGRDTDLGRDVAIKLLRDDHLHRPEMMQRFVEEAQIGGQLQHPGIVPVYELGLQEGGRPYFAMKLVKGRTLKELLGERKDHTENRRALLAHFQQVCQTVAYAHSRAVVHRDLKPSNIMIGSFGEVQVVDWGFAKVLHRGGIADERRVKRDVTIVATVRTATEGSGSVAGEVMGTPPYMPPEQALGHVDDLTERADVFSLGAILCEILTGAPAYVGSADDVFRAATHARLDDAYARLDRCGADGQLISLARACLSPLPKDRPRTARDVADVIGRVLAQAEVRAHSAQLRAAEAAAESEEQRRARRQTIRIAVVVLTVVLLGGGAWLARDNVEAQRERRRISAYEAAMLDATRFETAAEWTDARSAAERALGLTANDPARRIAAETVQARIKARADAADRAARKAEGEADLLASLEEIALRRAEDFDFRRADEAYQDALSDHAALRDFDRKEELALHFDAWAALRRLHLEGSDWRAPDRTARALDKNEWRNRLREAAANNDTGLLRQLATETDLEKQNARSLFQLGRALARIDRPAGLELLRRAHERYPNDAWLLLALVEFTAPYHWDKRGYFQGYAASRDELRKSAEYALAAVALRPDSLRLRFMFGQRLAYGGNLDDALAQYREVARKWPGGAVAFGHIGFALLQKGDLDGAIVALREAIRIDPRRPMFHFNLGSALADKGDLDGAIAALHEAIRIDPNNAATHTNLGTKYVDKGDLDRAIAAHREAIRIDPECYSAYTNLGSALQRKGDFKGAIAAHRKAIRVNPDHVVAHLNLGIALMTSQNNAEAIPSFRRVVELEPEHVIAHRLLGGALSNTGQLDEAIRVLNRAVALDATDATSYQFLYTTYRKKGDARRALEAARMWLRTTADALCAKGQFKQAVRVYEREFGLAEVLYADPRTGMRHAAARAGARADARGRSLAVAWLRSDLEAWMQIDDRDARRAALHAWLKDPALASIRDAAELPDGASELWDTVEAALK